MIQGKIFIQINNIRSYCVLIWAKNQAQVIVKRLSLVIIRMLSGQTGIVQPYGPRNKIETLF